MQATLRTFNATYLLTNLFTKKYVWRKYVSQMWKEFEIEMRNLGDKREKELKRDERWDIYRRKKIEKRKYLQKIYIFSSLKKIYIL